MHSRRFHPPGAHGWYGGGRFHPLHPRSASTRAKRRVSRTVEAATSLSTRARVRAHLDEDCPALDFYRGFYLQVEDDHLCAHRDAIHSRMGGSCTIDKFKQLVPKLPR